MLWFEGQIAEAISKAKQQKSLFVVYINGTNDDSTNMDKTWEEEDVLRMCQEANLVVMKFEANSEECKQFSAYYPVICIPCVYLISGENGTLLESIAGFASSSDLVQKIEKVVETLKQEKGAAAAVPIQPESVQDNTSAGSASAPSDPSESQKESAHERAARMRQKMEEAHRRKEDQRKKTEKEKELERRKAGQQIQKADQERSEMQAKQLADELRKKRLEDKLAREKVLEQLARDKAEKEAHFQSERGKREQQKLQAQQEKQAAQMTEQANKAASRMDTATIQFRLPDGSTMTNKFQSSAPLQEALDFVTQKVGDSLKEFTLSMTYPRRNFGPDEMQTSFLDLELVPRAAIVVLPGHLIPTSRQSSSRASTSSLPSGGDTIFSWFLAPFLVIYNFIYSIIFGTPSVTMPSQASSAGSSPASSPAAQAHSSGEEDSPSVERNLRAAGARPKSSYVRRRAPASGRDADNFSRQEGNIHRLNTQQADNDENNTWNGNSTQQM